MLNHSTVPAVLRVAGRKAGSIIRLPDSIHLHMAFHLLKDLPTELATGTNAFTQCSSLLVFSWGCSDCWQVNIHNCVASTQTAIRTHL